MTTKARYIGAPRRFPDLGVVRQGDEHEVPKLSRHWVPSEPDKLTKDELTSYLLSAGHATPADLEGATKADLVKLVPDQPKPAVTEPEAPDAN